MVSVAVLVIITTIALVNNSRFGGTILVTNLAYDIALSMRQAQVFGLSVKEVTPGGGEFQAGYGVHFANSTPTTYILFADRNFNLRYDGASENIEIYTISRGNRINAFCATLPSEVEKCAPDIGILDIVFERPNPDALFATDILTDTYGAARVVVRSPQGIEKTISVSSTGQISVTE